MEKKTNGEKELREKLIDALVDDQLGYRTSQEGARELLRGGFVGFEKMSDAELVQCSHDAGLPERDEAIGELTKKLDLSIPKIRKGGPR